MAYVFWTHDLETGFEDIDEQHKHLVDCLEQLYVANETNDREKSARFWKS